MAPGAKLEVIETNDGMQFELVSWLSDVRKSEQDCEIPDGMRLTVALAEGVAVLCREQ